MNDRINLYTLNNKNLNNKEISILSHNLLMKILEDCYGIKKDKIIFNYNDFGKPFIKDLNINFNISHTKNHIAIAVSGSEIGIDIEDIRIRDEKIAKKYFTPEEQNYIEFHKNNKTQGFIEIWTRKEAKIKSLGKTILNIKNNKFNVLNPLETNKYFTKTYNDFILSAYKSNGFKNLEIYTYII